MRKSGQLLPWILRNLSMLPRAGGQRLPIVAVRFLPIANDSSAVAATQPASVGERLDYLTSTRA